MDISTLGYALLAILARGPLSGYDLAQRMKKPIGFFWQSQLSQIYPELAHLEAQECVTHQVIVQEDRPQKKVYTITDAGNTALKAWVTRSPTPPPERNELLLKTYAIWVADPEAAIEMFRTQKQAHAERLALYEQNQALIIQENGGVPCPHEPLFGNYATVRMGIAYEREYVEWCHWMTEQFELAFQSQLRDNQ